MGHTTKDASKWMSLANEVGFLSRHREELHNERTKIENANKKELEGK